MFFLHGLNAAKYVAANLRALGGQAEKASLAMGHCSRYTLVPPGQGRPQRVASAPRKLAPTARSSDRRDHGPLSFAARDAGADYPNFAGATAVPPLQEHPWKAVGLVTGRTRPRPRCNGIPSRGRRASHAQGGLRASARCDVAAPPIFAPGRGPNQADGPALATASRGHSHGLILRG